MKEFLMKALAKKIDEAELNREAIKAATHYLKKMGTHLKLFDQQNMVNQVAHGFHIGWKAAEDYHGISKK
jgi:hypothetical protein